MVDLSHLLEAGSIGLILLSFFTSFMTASIGIGGGTLMLAAMAQILPAAAIMGLLSSTGGLPVESLPWRHPSVEWWRTSAGSQTT